jgi:hypothetical protein
MRPTYPLTSKLRYKLRAAVLEKHATRSDALVIRAWETIEAAMRADTPEEGIALLDSAERNKIAACNRPAISGLKPIDHPKLFLECIELEMAIAAGRMAMARRDRVRCVVPPGEDVLHSNLHHDLRDGRRIETRAITAAMMWHLPCVRKDAKQEKNWKRRNERQNALYRDARLLAETLRATGQGLRGEEMAAIMDWPEGRVWAVLTYASAQEMLVDLGDRGWFTIDSPQGRAVINARHPEYAPVDYFAEKSVA